MYVVSKWICIRPWVVSCDRNFSISFQLGRIVPTTQQSKLTACGAKNLNKAHLWSASLPSTLKLATDVKKWGFRHLNIYSHKINYSSQIAIKLKPLIHQSESIDNILYPESEFIQKLIDSFKCQINRLK